MSERNKYDTRMCLETGKRAERIFKYLCQGRGWSVQKAKKFEDINEYWDYCINKEHRSLKVEVKAIKRIHRHDDDMQDQWTWIELHGVRPYDKGWLFGSKADIIAFETYDSFVLVKRQKLIDFVLTRVNMEEYVEKPTNARYKVYSRNGRPDRITLVETSELRRICIDEWVK